MAIHALFGSLTLAVMVAVRPCPTKASQILTYDRTGAVSWYKPEMLDVACADRIGALLERERRNVPDIDTVAYYFLLNRLADLQSRCRTSASEAFRLEAKRVAREGATLQSQFHGPPFEPIVSADAPIEAGRYERGFRAFARLDLSQQIATENLLVVPTITSGIMAGANGEFPRAERAFRLAFSHANSPYPLPEALYFLGVARLALGERSAARATWCTGLRLVFFQHSSSISNVDWNLLLAKHLASP